MNQAASLCIEEVRNDMFHLFDVEDLLPSCQILVNVSIPIVSFLAKGKKPTSIIAQRVLTDTEMRVLLPLLASPACCPQEVLQASYHCTYEILLQSVFPLSGSTTVQWNELVEEHRHRLWDANERKTRRMEMRGIYNALYTLRQKLEQVGLTVRSRKDGYYLSAL